MTLKTTKTLFFIPIIGMMILPFGMVDTADAQNGPGEEDLQIWDL